MASQAGRLEGFNVVQAKSILQSTTFWGAVISLLSTLAPHVFANLFGGASQTVIVSNIITGIGFIITVYGRFSAKQVVTWTGANPPGGGAVSGTRG
jgi:hypothetical protein